MLNIMTHSHCLFELFVVYMRNEQNKKRLHKYEKKTYTRVHVYLSNIVYIKNKHWLPNKNTLQKALLIGK